VLPTIFFFPISRKKLPVGIFQHPIFLIVGETNFWHPIEQQKISLNTIALETEVCEQEAF